LAAGYARRAAVDSDQFANRATAALRDDSVRSLIADRITDGIVLKKQTDLIAARPIIQSVASGVVGSGAFTKLFRSAVRDVHRALFSGDQQTLTLTVADIGTVVAAALEELRPSLARQVEATGSVALLSRDVGTLSTTLADVAGRVRLLALFLLVLCVVLVAAAVAISRDRRRTVVGLGDGAAVAGVLVVVGLGVTRSVAVNGVEGPEAQGAVGAVWDSFLGDLRTASWILAGCGAVVAAAASSLIRPVDIGEPMRRAARVLSSEPLRPWLRALRGAGLVALGVTVIVATEEVVNLVVTLVGVYLVYEGVSVLLRLVYRPPAPGDDRAPAPKPAARRRLATPLIAAALVAAAVVAFVATGGTTTAAPPSGACNGHEALCDRPLDEVALAATHNSMSVPLPGWYSSSHDRPIADQLRDGVRGLLIDTHYADRLPNGRIRTYFGSREELRRRAGEDGVGADGVGAAMRIRERLGFAGEGERGMYLCHSFCELGATPLADVLDDLHDFLVANPDEVLVVINQDYVTPEDFVAAVKEAELEDCLPRAGQRRLAHAAPDDRQRPARGLPGRERGRRGLLVPARVPADHRGDPLRLLRRGEADDHGEAAGELRVQPRPRGRASLPPQPLDHHRPAAAAVAGGEGQRVRPAARARTRVPAPARPPAEPRGRELLPQRRSLPGGGHPQRRGVGAGSSIVSDDRVSSSSPWVAR